MLITNQKLLVGAITVFCATSYADTKDFSEDKQSTDKKPYYNKIENLNKNESKKYIVEKIELEKAYLVAMSRRDDNTEANNATDRTDNSDYTTNSTDLSDNQMSDTTVTTTTAQTPEEPSTGMGYENTPPVTNTQNRNVSKSNKGVTRTTNTNNSRGSLTTSPVNTPTAAGDVDSSVRTNAPTAQSQSTTPADAELTRKIRQGLMDTDLSTAAKNVTITTVNGAVTLRGEVRSMQEKNKVGDLAKAYAKNVKNQISVKP